ADVCNLAGLSRAPAVDTRAWTYRGYLIALAVVPASGLLASFKEVQKLYAVLGAAFLPLVAVALLVMNGRPRWVGSHTNRWPTIVALVVAVAFFAWAGVWCS